jgi:hypothetical protein
MTFPVNLEGSHEEMLVEPALVQTPEYVRADALSTNEGQ